MPTVKNTELNKNCDGCMAAKSALEGWRQLVVTAKTKVTKQHREIEQLKQENERLKVELRKLLTTKPTEPDKGE